MLSAVALRYHPLLFCLECAAERRHGEFRPGAVEGDGFHGVSFFVFALGRSEGAVHLPSMGRSPSEARRVGWIPTTPTPASSTGSLSDPPHTGEGKARLTATTPRFRSGCCHERRFAKIAARLRWALSPRLHCNRAGEAGAWHAPRLRLGYDACHAPAGVRVPRASLVRKSSITRLSVTCCRSGDDALPPAGRSLRPRREPQMDPDLGAHHPAMLPWHRRPGTVSCPNVRLRTRFPRRRVARVMQVERAGIEKRMVNRE
jgi:hypothetical protein